MYDSSIDEIKEYLKDFKKPLRPELFIRLIEHIYSCKVYVIDKKLENLIMVPRHVGGLCDFKYKSSIPIILIYTHMGAESDALTYPHHELIVYGKEYTSIWPDYNSNIRRIERMYSSLSQYQYLSYKIPLFPSTLQNELNVVAQKLDLYGKTRYLICSYNNEQFILSTSPLPPFNVPHVEHLPSQSENIVSIRTFLQEVCEYKGDETQQFMFKDLFFCRYYFNQQYEYSFTNFINNEKLSRYLTNVTTYLFSHYIAQNKLIDIKQNDIIKWVTDTFMLDESYVYDVSSMTNSFDKLAFTEEGKLICNSKELVWRLLYQLRILIERNRRNVAEFKDKHELDSYYTSEFDFKLPNNTVIIKGIDLVGNESSAIQKTRQGYS
jgi:hypothetical protein